MTSQRPGTPGGKPYAASGLTVPAAITPSTGFPDLPEATVARLPEYLRALHNLADTGHDTVSSEGLATVAGVNSAKLRKDLSHLGSYGTRGVGYDVTLLIEQIETVLGLNQRRAVALVGVGNLGHALANYGGFVSRGFRIAALFDAAPGRVGEKINGLTVHHVSDLSDVVAAERRGRHAGLRGTVGCGPTRRVWGDQHPELRSLCAVGAGGRRRTQGRSRHRVANPLVPRASKGVAHGASHARGDG
jgi:redox-sensing transcriptional repressor